MPKQGVVYFCLTCNKHYDEYENARECEHKHQKDKEEQEHLKLMSKHFPKNFKDDTNFATHCVDCGILLINYEDEFDGHDHITRGRLLAEIPHKTIFGGKYCKLCADKKEALIIYAMEKLYGN